jgi:small subunit ribosomal protein S11
MPPKARVTKVRRKEKKNVARGHALIMSRINNRSI